MEKKNDIFSSQVKWMSANIAHKKHVARTWNSIAKLGNYSAQPELNMGRLIIGNVGSGASIRLWIDAWASDKPFRVLQS